IPPGVDIFGTVSTYMDKSGYISNADSFWKEEYHELFLGICKRYEHVIEVVFSAHTHMDEYKLLLENDSIAYKATITVPSVSPIFGNDPAFRVVTMDRENWELLDYRSVACHGFYYSGHNAANNINATNWPAYWCGIGKMVKDEYIECVNSYRSGGASTPIIFDNSY
ncbi:MAG: hypothetical protein JRF52_14540, partial [Deltaproteobacteria bacterium]|nr:hypothetical protein [Deltaproteobacteria bacterium]